MHEFRDETGLWATAGSAPRADAAGINEPATTGVVAEQQRSEVGR